MGDKAAVGESAGVAVGVKVSSGVAVGWIGAVSSILSSTASCDKE